jgi:hypothetical protein
VLRVAGVASRGCCESRVLRVADVASGYGRLRVASVAGVTSVASVTGPTGNAGTGRSGMRVLDEAARSGMRAPAESMGNTMAG